MRIRFKNKKNGYIIILFVGVLAMFVIIGIAFTVNARFEVQIAEKYKASVKAKYVVELAIAEAIAELKYGADGAVNNAVDTTLESWYGDEPYGDDVDLGGGWKGEYKVVKIIDCASQININNTHPNLNNILTILNTELGNPLIAADITNIINSAPYETKEQLLTVTDINDTKYNAIKDYITVYGYIDPDTIDPLDITDPPYETQARAPINVNTASREVLIAVLSGIKVDNACPKCGGDGYQNGAYAGHYGCTACGGSGQGATRINGTGDLEITSTEASDLADYIITNRSVTSYRSWSEFYSSIKLCALIGEKDADLIMANFNPNTGFSWVRNVAWHEDLGYIGKYVIDMDRNGTVNSSDKGLTNSTTEFTFNSGGYYEINAQAEIKNQFNIKISEKELTAVVKIFDIYRETTQAQFDQGTKSNVDSYPEPDVGGVSSAQYSGQLALSVFSHTTPNAGDHFRANYKTTISADSSGGNSSLIADPGVPTIGSTASSSNRGELVPDGMSVTYLDSIRSKYWPLNNADADEGTMIIWFKPRYPGNDTVNYSATGTENQNRKMYRFTSDTQIPGYSGGGGWSHSILWFWSDYNDLWSGARRGGGNWNGSSWGFSQGWWWGWTSSGFPNWKIGEWQQLVWSWENPPNPTGPYDTTNNPIKLYSNGNNLRTSIYYYHPPYGNTTSNRAMYTACEYDSWNGYQMELSSAIVGSVRVYPTRLSDAAVQADYLSGIYQSNGTFTSSVFDPPGVNNVEWGTITWTEAIPSAGGDLVFNFDSGGGWQANFNDPATGNSLSNTSSTIRYRTNFSSVTNRDTPILEDVTITYLGPTQILYWREVYD